VRAVLGECPPTSDQVFTSNASKRQKLFGFVDLEAKERAYQSLISSYIGSLKQLAQNRTSLMASPPSKNKPTHGSI